MFEYEVILTSGEQTFLFGYSRADALKRSSLDWGEVKFWLSCEYID